MSYLLKLGKTDKLFNIKISARERKNPKAINIRSVIDEAMEGP